MMNTSNQDELESLYSKFMKVTDVMVADHGLYEVASVMMIIALGIYKTSMNDDEYEKMVVSIFDKRKEIKKLNVGPSIE